jgi:hypothetical protein
VLALYAEPQGGKACEAGLKLKTKIANDQQEKVRKIFRTFFI